MAAYSPAAIKTLFSKVSAKYPDVKNGGILANKSGYHNARSRLPRSDYSVADSALDREGDADAASAIDLTPGSQALQQKLSKRLMDASLAKDPRLKPLREWFGSLDSKKVTGYSLLRKRKVTSDSSHLWHLHLSIHRKYADDKEALSKVADVLLGVPLKTEPAPTPPPALTDSVKLPAIKGAVMTRAFEFGRVMDMPVATGLQDFEKFGAGWLLGQSVAAAVGEDSIFNRFGENLQYRDRMICRGAGHNSAFATSGPYVWMAWDKISGGKIVDHRVARVRYRAGTVKDTDDDITFYDPLTATQYMHPSLDLDHSRIALRAATRFVLHDLDTFKAGKNEPYPTVLTKLPGPFQGHASYSSGLWVVTGETNGPAALSEFSWTTGKQTAELDLTSLLKMVGASSYEPQGVYVSRGAMPTVHVGARFGSAAKRRFIVFKIANLIKAGT